jgi:hypothetical protein
VQLNSNAKLFSITTSFPPSSHNCSIGNQNKHLTGWESATVSLIWCKSSLRKYILYLCYFSSLSLNISFLPSYCIKMDRSQRGRRKDDIRYRSRSRSPRRHPEYNRSEYRSPSRRPRSRSSYDSYLPRTSAPMDNREYDERSMFFKSLEEFTCLSL